MNRDIRVVPGSVSPVLPAWVAWAEGDPIAHERGDTLSAFHSGWDAREAALMDHLSPTSPTWDRAAVMDRRHWLTRAEEARRAGDIVLALTFEVVARVAGEDSGSE